MVLFKDDFHEKIKHMNTLFQFIKNNKNQQFIEYLSNLNPTEFDINIKDEHNNYLIFFAIMTNNRSVLKKILEFNVRFDVLDTEGYSLLYYPIKFHYPEIIDILLAKDQELVGVSIKDMKDAKGYTPILYAIRYNNHHALQELLNVNADVTYKNSKHMNALHLAVLKKDIMIVKMIITYIKNVNVKTITGDTALHYACTYQLFDIIQILLKHGADPNIYEYENNLYPIYYSVIQNDIDITKLLITAGYNIQNQDIDGNTIIHYAILYNHIHIIDFIFSQFEVKKYSTFYTENITDRKNLGESESLTNIGPTTYYIDPTLVNINGLTILHLFLYNYIESYIPYIQKIIIKASLDIQDNLGNTPLHLLIENNLWDIFSDILITKPLNIYVKNNDGKSVFDQIKISSIEKFTDILMKSYSFYLTNKKAEWMFDWQNLCAKILASTSTSTPVETNDCRNHIKKSIMSDRISVPQQKSKQNITIEANHIVQFTTFGGYQLDIISGFKYLIDKHANKKVGTIFHISPHYDPELEKYNEMIGIEISTHRYLFHFEILWIFQQLFLPPQLEQNLSNIISSKKLKYLILPIGIILSNGTHSNVIIYNIEDNILERFEPHGSGYPYQFNYNPNLLDDQLRSKMNNMLSNIYKKHVNVNYLKPGAYLPKIGFQLFENMEMHLNKNIGDPNGFCTLWCIWYLDYRFSYIDIPPIKLIKKIIKEIRHNNLSFRNIIRNYSLNITDLRDSYLKKINKNINDYINNRISDTDKKKLITYIVS